MAKNIALKDEEYAPLISQLRNMHADCIEQLGTIVTQLRMLNELNGGFQSKNLSANIRELLIELETVKNTISEIFDTHEEVITSFETVIDDYDSLN